MAAVAEAVDLRKTYGIGETAVQALAGVSVIIERGQLTAVMGPSGSGKSTLMHCMAGLDRASSGSSFIKGQDLRQLDDNQLSELRRDRVGFVFQSFNLIPTLSLEENITLPLDLAGKRLDRAWFDCLVTRLGLGERLAHRPNELSGGQQQRAACARALISNPDLVFADEPTGNLDSTSSARLLSFLRQSVEDFHQSIVMVTHDPMAATYADRVVFLADGLIVESLENPSADSVIKRLRTLAL